MPDDIAARALREVWADRARTGVEHALAPVATGDSTAASDDVYAKMMRLELPESEVRDFHARHPEIFDGRDFESSRDTATLLARIERTREELGLPPGPAGSHVPLPGSDP